MSTEPSAASGRSDAAAEADPPARTSSHGLTDVAAAIARVEALIGPDAEPAPDGADAIDRIADIAFVLHERDVEPSLCDSLDAAVRDLGAAIARSETSAQRIREAIEVLGDLARRVDAIIASSQAEPGGGDESGADLRRAGFFAAGLAEDDAFAKIVASLAAALPALARAAAAEPRSPPADERPADRGDGPQTSDLVDGIESGGAGSQRDASAAIEAEGLKPIGASGILAQSEPPGAADPVPSIGPDDDPGDLFEPLEQASGDSARAMLQTADAGSGPAQSAKHVSEDTGERVTPASRPPPSDPLAPIRALSEEELIALFS